MWKTHVLKMIAWYTINTMEPQQDIHSKHHVFIRVAGAVLAIILIIGGVLFYRKSILPVSPTLSDEQMKLNELARLEASSKPITTTLQERTDNLVKLGANSKPITTTFENRLQALEVLSQ